MAQWLSNIFRERDYPKIKHFNNDMESTSTTEFKEAVEESVRELRHLKLHDT